MDFGYVLSYPGLGRGIVIATGDRTVMGRIANLVSDTNNTSTTMAREMQAFVNMIIVASAIMAVAFLAALLGLGYDWIVAFVFLIGIIMGNVPEGLLTTVTVGASIRNHRLLHTQLFLRLLQFALVTFGNCRHDYSHGYLEYM